MTDKIKICKKLNLFNKNDWSTINGFSGLIIIPLIFYSINKEFLPGGFLCIDILFVIAGYSISLSLEKIKSNNLFGFISSFYLNGIKNFIPSLAFFTLITSLLISFFSQKNEISLITGITSLFGFSNIYMWRKGINFFDMGIILNPFSHTWGISILAQFFAIYPIYLWYSGFKKKKKNNYNNLNISVFCLVLISLLYFIYFFKSNQTFSFYVMPTRLWEIGIGCLTFSAIKDKNTITKYLQRISPFLPLSIIIFLFFSIKSFSLFATITTVILSSLLFFTFTEGKVFFNFLTSKKLVYLGSISFQIYLWTWGIFTISRWTVGIHWWSIPLQIYLIFLISSFSYRKVDAFFYKSFIVLSNYLKIIFVGIVLLIPSIFTLFLVKPLQGISYLGNYKYEKLITRSRNSFNKSNENLDGRNYNGNNCHLPGSTLYTSEVDFDKCKIIKDGPKTIFFLGASHTDHLRETHFRISKYNNVSIDSTTVSGCNFPHDPSHRSCGDIQIKQKERILSSINAGDLVVISNRFIINQSWLNESAFKRLENFGNEIALKGGKVILFAPTPEFDLSIALCKSEWFRPFQNKSCSVSEKVFRNKRENSYKLLNGFSDNILVYDPMKKLCLNGVCSMMDNLDKPLYTDTDHLTDYANSEYLYNDFLNFLLENNILK